MKYTVKPAIVEGCDCEECRAGRHLYALYRLPEIGSNWSAMSLQTYSSAEECKQNHYWGIEFGPDDTWEDGTPIVESNAIPEAHPDGPQPSKGGMVPLNTEALQKSAKLLEKHWLPRDSSR
ncbi:MAG: hypothetical protein ACLQU3_05035 [Limisphaerales bacterium]